MTYYTNCRQAHLGLCRLRDVNFFDTAFKAGTEVNRSLLNRDDVLEGDWVSIRCICSDTVLEKLYYVAHQSFSDPKKMLTGCDEKFMPNGDRHLFVKTSPLMFYPSPPNPNWVG